MSNTDTATATQSVINLPDTMDATPSLEHTPESMPESMPENTPLESQASLPVIESNMESNIVLKENTLVSMCNNIINDVCVFLTEYSDIDYMRDGIINKRACDIMLNKYTSQFKSIILYFIEYLTTNKDILDYINTNNKLTYNIHHYENIHKNMYNFLYVYDNMIDSNDIAQGWLNWDYYNECFFINNKINIKIKQYIINTIIKHVFLNYENKNCLLYEFLDTKKDLGPLETLLPPDSELDTPQQEDKPCNINDIDDIDDIDNINNMSDLNSEESNDKSNEDGESGEEGEGEGEGECAGAGDDGEGRGEEGDLDDTQGDMKQFIQNSMANGGECIIS